MASVKFPEKQLTELRAFVTLIKSQPEILHQPELEFFKSYIESIGGVIPAVKTTNEPKSCPFSGKPKESEKKYASVSIICPLTQVFYLLRNNRSIKSRKRFASNTFLVILRITYFSKKMA